MLQGRERKLDRDRKEGAYFSPSSSHSLNAVIENTRGKAAVLRDVKSQDIFCRYRMVQLNILTPPIQTCGASSSSLRVSHLTIAFDSPMKVAWITATLLPYNANKVFTPQAQ